MWWWTWRHKAFIVIIDPAISHTNHRETGNAEFVFLQSSDNNKKRNHQPIFSFLHENKPNMMLSWLGLIGWHGSELTDVPGLKCPFCKAGICWSTPTYLWLCVFPAAAGAAEPLATDQWLCFFFAFASVVIMCNYDYVGRVAPRLLCGCVTDSFFCWLILCIMLWERNWDVYLVS